MPTATGRTTEGELALLYGRFFEKVPHLLEDESVLYLYKKQSTYGKKLKTKRFLYYTKDRNAI